MLGEYKKQIIWGVLLIGIIFFISFCIGFFSSKNTENEIKTIKTDTHCESTSPPTDTMQNENSGISYYLINVSSGKLKMYYVNDESITELKSEEISVEVFPSDDRITLTEGIKTETSEEALEVWENFIS